MRSELLRFVQPKDRTARRVALAAIAAAWGVALGATWGAPLLAPGSAFAQEASTPPVVQRSADQDAAMKELAEALREILGGAPTQPAETADDGRAPVVEATDTLSAGGPAPTSRTRKPSDDASASSIVEIEPGGASEAASTSQTRASEPAVASSKPIRVLGGEHADHSRLVIGRLPVDDWSVSSTADGVEIRIPQRGLSFDVERIVKTRTAHRVVSAETVDTTDGTILRFGYNCACRADVSTLQGGQLKIDVRDGAPEAIAEAPAASGPTSSTAQASTTWAGSEDSAPERASVEDIAPDGPQQIAQAASPSSEAGPAPLDLGPLETASTLQGDVDAAREALLSSLRSAAEQGVVSFVTPETSDDASGATEAQPVAANTEPQVETIETTSTPTDERSSQTAEGAVSGLTAETTDDPTTGETIIEAEDAPGVADQSNDAVPPADGTFGPAQAALAERLQAAITALNQSPDPLDLANADFIGATVDSHCLADVDLDPRNWRDRRPFFEGLQRKRAWIYDDLNRADPVAVASLSRFYIAHGLGEEAAMMPASHQVDTEETRFAQHLADVLMKHPPAEGSPFFDRKPCEGLHGVWQAAALSDVDPEAAVAAYRESDEAIVGLLSPHRRMFGARIARAAAEIGELELARALLETLSRNSDAPTLDMLWAQAEIELEDGSARRGRRALQMIMSSRTEQAPLAAIRLAATYAPGQSLTDAQDVSDLSAALQDFALQYRRTDTGAQAIAAEASLVARYGDLASAVELLDRSFKRWPELTERLRTRKTDLIQNEIAAAVDDPTPERLSAAVRAAAMLDPTGAGDTLRIALAETLLGAGVPDLAPLVITEDVAKRSTTAAQLLVEAKAAGALTPASEAAAPDEATQLLRATPNPEMRFDQPISSGRAMVQTLETELELMREIARGGARQAPVVNAEQ